MAAAENPVPRALPTTRSEDSRGLVLKHAANELVFAVVGHVVSGTSEIAEALSESLAYPTLPGGDFQVQVLKPRNLMKCWPREKGPTVPARDPACLEYS